MVTVFDRSESAKTGRQALLGRTKSSKIITQEKSNLSIEPGGGLPCVD
jgi:hypothetical protein